MGLIYLAVFMSGCSGSQADDPPTHTLPIPTIQLISITPNTIRQYTDSLIFSIEYIDGNGDLGDANPDAQNLLVTDMRLGLIHKLRIPQLSPTNVPIKGILTFTLKNIILQNTENNLENARFKIQVIDRAGNKSNELTTPDITITQ